MNCYDNDANRTSNVNTTAFCKYVCVYVPCMCLAYPIVYMKKTKQNNNVEMRQNKQRINSSEKDREREEQQQKTKCLTVMMQEESRSNVKKNVLCETRKSDNVNFNAFLIKRMYHIFVTSFVTVVFQRFFFVFFFKCLKWNA